MLNKKSKHPAHPCLTCGELTTNKTYCDTHYGLYIGFAFTPNHKKGICAPVDGRPTWRRREDANTIRRSK